MSGIALQNLNWADYAIIGIVLISIVISLMRGFLRESVSLITWIVAFFVAYKFSVPLGDLFSTKIATPTLRLVFSFIILFVLILIVGGLINHLIYTMVEKTGLSGTDRLLGVIFGSARGILLVAVLILLANYTTFAKDPWWTASQLIPQFKSLVTWLQNFLPQQYNQISALGLVNK